MLSVSGCISHTEPRNVLWLFVSKPPPSWLVSLFVSLLKPGTSCWILRTTPLGSWSARQWRSQLEGRPSSLQVGSRSERGEKILMEIVKENVLEIITHLCLYLLSLLCICLLGLLCAWVLYFEFSVFVFFSGWSETRPWSLDGKVQDSCQQPYR